MYILGSNITLYEAKQKPAWAGFGDRVRAHGPEMYLYVSIGVR